MALCSAVDRVEGQLPSLPWAVSASAVDPTKAELVDVPVGEYRMQFDVSLPPSVPWWLLTFAWIAPMGIVAAAARSLRCAAVGATTERPGSARASPTTLAARRRSSTEVRASIPPLPERQPNLKNTTAHAPGATTRGDDGARDVPGLRDSVVLARHRWAHGHLEARERGTHPLVVAVDRRHQDLGDHVDEV